MATAWAGEKEPRTIGAQYIRKIIRQRKNSLARSLPVDNQRPADSVAHDVLNRTHLGNLRASQPKFVGESQHKNYSRIGGMNRALDDRATGGSGSGLSGANHRYYQRHVLIGPPGSDAPGPKAPDRRPHRPRRFATPMMSAHPIEEIRPRNRPRRISETRPSKTAEMIRTKVDSARREVHGFHCCTPGFDLRLPEPIYMNSSHQPLSPRGEPVRYLRIWMLAAVAWWG